MSLAETLAHTPETPPTLAASVQAEPITPFAAAVAAWKALDEAHSAAINAYGAIETRVFAKEISRDDPAYIAAELAEQETCAASMLGFGAVLDADPLDMGEAVDKLQMMVEKASPWGKSPHDAVLDEDGALVPGNAYERCLRDIVGHLPPIRPRPTAGYVASTTTVPAWAANHVVVAVPRSAPASFRALAEAYATAFQANLAVRGDLENVDAELEAFEPLSAALWAMLDYPTFDRDLIAFKRAVVQEPGGDEEGAYLSHILDAALDGDATPSPYRDAWAAAAAAYDAAVAAEVAAGDEDSDFHGNAVLDAHGALEATPAPDLWAVIRKIEMEALLAMGHANVTTGREALLKAVEEGDASDRFLLAIYLDIMRMAVEGPGLTADRWVKTFLEHGGSFHRMGSQDPAPMWIGQPVPGDVVLDALRDTGNGALRREITKLARAMLDGRSEQTGNPDVFLNMRTMAR